MKYYTTKAAANRAVKTKGLQAVQYKVEDRGGKFIPVFRHWLIEDVNYIRGKGFPCTFDPTCEPVEQPSKLEMLAVIQGIA